MDAVTFCGVVVSLAIVYNVESAPITANSTAVDEPGVLANEISHDSANLDDVDKASYYSNRNDLSNTYDSDGAYESQNEDYFSFDDYDSFGICTDSYQVLTADNDVKSLSPTSLGPTTDENPWYHWTIVPKNEGGSVTVAKSDNVISGDVFQGGCSDVHMFQTMSNSTIPRAEWCHEKRLLSCDVVTQIQYNILGRNPTSEPGMGIDVVYIPDISTYTVSDNKLFSIYYYECGGKRFGGDIRSPRFPVGAVPRRVTCKWELELRDSTDHGVVRFNKFNLPYCKNHKLIIEEDTLLDEKDVEDYLLEMLLAKERQENVTEELIEPVNLRNSPNRDIRQSGYLQNATERDSKPGHFIAEAADTEHASIFVYRDSKISKKEVAKNPKAGIHVVEIVKFCGAYKPKKRLFWNRGSKNVTISFVSTDLSLSNFGFTARFSAASWDNIFRDRTSRMLRMSRFRPRDTTRPHFIFTYIMLIVFVPIGLTIGLSIIIFHIKNGGPTLKEFQKKEKEERQLLRSITCRVRSVSPRVKRSVRRAKSVDYPQSILANSERAKRRISNRRPSLPILDVQFLISGKSPSLQLKTVLGTTRAKEDQTSTKKKEKKRWFRGIS